MKYIRYSYDELLHLYEIFEGDPERYKRIMKKIISITLILLLLVMTVGVAMAQGDIELPEGMTWEEYQDAIEKANQRYRENKK